MLQTRIPRGVVILFGIFVLVILLAVGGLAIDIGAMLTARSELHQATDAAALAGAGNLGFDATVFPDVRAAAVQFGAWNPHRYGPVTLDPNPSNAAGGDVVLGIWNAGTFTPSLNGTMVNAVRCRTQQSFPTSFLRIIGLNSLSVSADSIAVSNPPSTIPGSLFPIGISQCAYGSNEGNYGSQGCGSPMKLIDSGDNNAAWVNVTGSLDTPNAQDITTAISNAYNATSSSGSFPAGQTVGVNNGMVQSAFDLLSRCNTEDGTNCQGYFNTKYDSSPTYTLKNPDGSTRYVGKGWEVFVPIIETSCPPGPIDGDKRVLTFARMVITQVINKGWCGVPNHASGNEWDALCPPPNGTSTEPKDGNLRAVFGHFDCNKIESVPTSDPAPRAALATRIRLVR